MRFCHGHSIAPMYYKAYLGQRFTTSVLRHSTVFRETIGNKTIFELRKTIENVHESLTNQTNEQLKNT